MLLKFVLSYGVVCLSLFTLAACQQEDAPGSMASEAYATPPFAKIIFPADNPTTPEGLALGERLFFDPILSADSTISCRSCHLPALAFSDGRPVSVGINGKLGRRNSPSLANIGYRHTTMFWDGRASDLETQALHPVADPNEMGGDWPTIIARLRNHPTYGEALRSAFGLSSIRQITPDHVGKALAQFQRSLVSYNSKYDQVLRGEASYTASEARGHSIFFDEADFSEDPAIAALPVAECAHCHTAPHFTNHRFFNNGLDEAPTLTEFADLGRGAITDNHYQNGLFRTPGLRNVALTAPYMHDGRMTSLEQVIEHYNQGGHYAENRSANVRPLSLSSRDKADLIAFLHTLTDTVFVNQYAR